MEGVLEDPSAVDLRAVITKNAVMLVSTVTTTASSVKIPQFRPWAIGEFDSP